MQPSPKRLARYAINIKVNRIVHQVENLCQIDDGHQKALCRGEAHPMLDRLVGHVKICVVIKQQQTGNKIGQVKYDKRERHDQQHDMSLFLLIDGQLKSNRLFIIWQQLEAQLFEIVFAHGMRPG